LQIHAFCATFEGSRLRNNKKFRFVINGFFGPQKAQLHTESQFIDQKNSTKSCHGELLPRFHKPYKSALLLPPITSCVCLLLSEPLSRMSDRGDQEYMADLKGVNEDSVPLPEKVNRVT
jgi:hypothetical protein